MVADTEEGWGSAVMVGAAAVVAVIWRSGGGRIWPTSRVVTSHSWRRTEGGMFETIVSGICVPVLWLEGRQQSLCDGDDMMVGVAVTTAVKVVGGAKCT